MGPNESLSLRLLTKKLATLLALILAHRCSDLGRLSLEGRKYSLEGAVLKCTGKPGQGSKDPFVQLLYPPIQRTLYSHVSSSTRRQPLPSEAKKDNCS